MGNNFRALTYEEYFIYNAEYLTLASGTGVAFTDFLVKVAKDVDFKFYGISYIADDARIRMRILDDSFGRYLQKGSPDMRAIAGRPITGDFSMASHHNDFLPFMWPVPYRVSAGATLTVQASDFSGAAQNVRISFHGSKMRNGPAPWLKNYRYRIPFIYEIDLGAITASSTLVGVLSTDTDADFLVQTLTGVRTGPATILIQEGARGRDWMDRATHFDNVIGTSYHPNNMLIKTPRFITRGGNVSISVTDLSGAANTVRVYFVGMKLYG